MSEHGFRIPPLIFAALLPWALATAVTAQEEATPAPEESGATIELEPADEGASAPLTAVEGADVGPPPAPGSPAAEGAAAVEDDPAADGPPEGETTPAPPEEDLAADFYLSRCAGCHTIGEGFLSGPDLAPSTEWPAPDLAKAVERMEKNVGPMTDEQVASLVELLKGEDVKRRLSAARERQVAEMAATLEPASPATGEALFHGGRAFRNAGVACSACHKVGARGGTLAVDLTDSSSRLGEQALISAAENPGFPLMRAAYASHPVTRQEAVHLAAYLEEVDEEAADAGRAEAGAAARTPLPARIGLWGFGAAALFLGAMVLLYRGRVRGVRAGLVQRASQR